MSKVKQSLKVSKKTKKFIPNLTATPTHVCFKNYEEGKVYTEQIQILNQDLKTYHIAIKFDNPEDIKMSIVGSGSKTRLDSGEDLLFEIEFRPTLSFKKESEDRRYEICLNVVNANAKFFIPVLVLSPNPIINFPKEITLPATAVNWPAYSNIYVLNYSNHAQKFSFECRSEIKIIPDCKTIGMKPSDGATFLIEFIPKSVGLFREKIHVCTADGEKKFAIVIKCFVIPINIFLNEESIEFSPTFIGMRESKEIHIINNSDEATYFEWICLDQHRNEKKEDQALDCTRYLEIFPKNGKLQPNTITAINIVFKPEDTDDDEFEVLKDFFFSFGLKLSVEVEYQPHLNVRGKIVGPNFQLDYKNVDIGTLFLGESRFIDVNISNTGIINGKIIFQKSPSSFDGIVKVSSKGELMSPGEMKTFKIKYLARKQGKFLEQAFFKVKNGEKLSLVIQGVIKPLELVIEPDVVRFAEVTMCVPELMLLMMRNDLPFDVEVKIEVENTGDESTLEFLEFFRHRKEDFWEDLPPSHSSMRSEESKALTLNNSKSTDSCSSLIAKSSIKHFMEKTGKLEHLRDSVSAANEGINKIYSRINEYLEGTDIVQNIIQSIFDGKVKDEAEKPYIVGTIVDLVIENIKDSTFIIFEPFDQKPWQIPENPRELEVNKSSFVLPGKGHQSSDVKVFLTPNFIGKFTKNLKLRVLITNLSSCSKQSVDETIINVPIIYDCQPPQLEISNRINSLSGYAESEIPLDILIANNGPVDGFFSFVNFEDPEMEVKCELGRFHIASNSKKIINLTVVPLKSGLIVKYVNLIVLGSNRKIPISIECRSKPPDIVVKPNKVFENDLAVLVNHDTRIFVENRSTSKARFFIKLKHENKAFEVNPKGGILSSKQRVMVTLSKFFYDPGDYRDILIVEIVNSKFVKIPIRCTVRNLPILIEPSITAIDFQTVFVSKTPYFLDFKFTNGGKSAYMVFVIMKNWKKNDTHFLVEPNRFELLPNASRRVVFYLNAETAFNPDEEFTIEGCSISFPVRELILESSLKAQIIRPNLTFSHDELIFDCFYDGRLDGFTKKIQIINKSNLSMEVAVKVEGNFFLETHACEKLGKAKFEVKARKSEDVHIAFDKSLLECSNAAQTFEGRVKAYFLGKLQATVNLRANLIYPTIDISCRDLNVVNNMLPCTFNFAILNNGQVDATFNLKFDENSKLITKIQERRQSNLMNITECLMKQKCNLKETFFKPDSLEQKAEAFLRIEDISSNYSFSDLQELKSIDIKESQPKSKGKTTKHDEKKTHEVGAISNAEMIAFLQENPDIDATVNDIQKYFKRITKSLSEVLFNNEEKTIRKLAKPKTEKSGEAISVQKYLKLSQITGKLKPNERRNISVQFVGSPEAFYLSTILRCDVSGGTPSQININITNCNPNLLITKTYFDLSERQRSNEISLKNLCITNIAPACNQIKLITEQRNETSQIINGFVKLCCKTEPCFILDDQRNFCANLKFSIFKGCASTFKDEFGIQVNEKPPIPISFAGMNKFPTATLLNFEQNALTEINKPFEYDCLREMFKSVSRIRVPEEEIKFEEVLNIKMQIKLEKEMDSVEGKQRRKTLKKDKKGNAEKSVSIDLAAGDGVQVLRDFGLFYEKNGKVVQREKPAKLYGAKMMHMIDDTLDEEGYQWLDYPDEYPEAVEITNFIAQQGFTESLKCETVFKEYKRIYNHHVLEKFRLKKSAVCSHPETPSDDYITPLPLPLPHYEIELGDVTLGGIVSKVLPFYWHGEHILAAFRSETFVPGFTAKFLANCELEVTDFIVAPDEPAVCYVNRQEREKMQACKAEPSVKRCHSFDFTSACVHSRKVPYTSIERDKINKIYNNVMAPRKKQERNPLVQSEIQQRSNFRGSKIFELQIEFAPSSEFYDLEMELDEVFYVDVHLGPQIPLHIKAKVKPDLTNDTQGQESRLKIN